MRPTPELTYEYRMARQRALRERDGRASEAQARIPRLREIAEERRQLVFDSGLMRMRGEQERAEAALARVGELNAEEEALLKANGLPGDYLKPRFRCGICGDTGYVGEVEKRLCPCIRQRIREADAGGGINTQEVFANFKPDIYPTEQQRRNALSARDVCEEYCREFPEQRPKDLLLMGGTGLGKSFLLNAMAAEVAGKGYEVWKTSAYNLINAALDRIRNREGTLDFTGPDLVLIDDLGTEPMMATVTRETLFSLINERQSAGKATVWATNRQYGNIQDSYGDRFFSRLVAFRNTKVILLEGQDLRMRLR